MPHNRAAADLLYLDCYNRLSAAANMAKNWYGGNREVLGSEGNFELQLTGVGVIEFPVNKLVFRAQVFGVELVNCHLSIDYVLL